MTDSNIPTNMEFWVVPLQKGDNEPYAKISDFGQAGEVLIEANAEEPQKDYVLKPVRVKDQE